MDYDAFGRIYECFPGECPCCGSDSARAGALAKDGFAYARCRNCAHMWLHPTPDPAACATIYDSGYFENGRNSGYANYLADEPLHRTNARARLRRLASAGGGPPGRLLEVGCAAGFFLDEAHALGWSVAGVDVSPWARAAASRVLGLEILESMDALLPGNEGAFSVGCFFQVLEHMPDPASALLQMRRLLRPDGLLAIETWDRGSAIARAMGRHWQQVSPPSVIHLFDRDGLVRLLRAGGFEVRSFAMVSKKISLGWGLGLLASKSRVFNPAERLVRRLGIGGWPFTYGFGDLITVMAAKTRARPSA
jgi:SAM-dependent methyltransferase